MASDVVTNTSDNCSITDTTLSQSVFNCSDIGAPVNIDVTLIDVAGNQVTEIVAITVEDNIDPTITCVGNQVENADATNSYTVTGTVFDPTATDDNCGVNNTVNDFNSSATLDGATLPVGTTTITWTVTDENGNTQNCSFDIQVDAYVGINNYNTYNEISIYPNPVHDFVIVESGELKMESVEIIDITGKIIDRFIVDDNMLTINFSNRTKGLHIIRVITNKGIIIKKLMFE